MANYSQVVLNTREKHYFGEPFSVEELETIPFLHPLVKCMRDEISATNKYLRDVNLQNKQDYDNFVALLNGDIVFRLKITHEYYLLLDLFKDPQEKARWIQFLNEMRSQEHEHKHNQKQQFTTTSPIKMNSVEKSSFVSNPPLFDWTHPPAHLSNKDKVQHYEQELQRRTGHYHAQKFRARQNALAKDTQEDSGYIDQIIRELRHDVLEERQAIFQLSGGHFEILSNWKSIIGYIEECLNKLSCNRKILL